MDIAQVLHVIRVFHGGIYTEPYHPTRCLITARGFSILKLLWTSQIEAKHGEKGKEKKSQRQKRRNNKLPNQVIIIP